MKAAGLVLIVVVAACSATDTPQGRTAPSPASTPSAAVNPSSAAVSPSNPTWSLGLGATALSTVDFSCRLPVFVDRGQGPEGAFIDFPSGKVTFDPAASAVPSIPGSGREFVGDTFYVHYYDRAYSRWLPVRRNDVSPDGAHYAYTDRALADPQQPPPTRATIHVVDVKTGEDHVFDDGQWSSPYVIVDYAAEGIYLKPNFTAYGLWLMDPATGAITEVANVWDVQGSSGNKVFWLGAVNPSDPHPINGLAPNEVDSFNLVDGTRTPWVYRPGRSVHFVSQDAAGHPIFITAPVLGPDELLLGVSPGVTRSIWTGGNNIPALGDPISDGHGVWFGSPSGIFLYSEANGMQKVSNQPGSPGNGCF